MVDDTESSTMSVTNPFTAAALRPQVSRINMPGRSTPASILADSFLAPENYLYLPDVPRITPDNNDEGLQTLAILAKENLHREYFKINSALQKKCEYMKRSLNIEDLNYLKPSNKKGKGENYCRIIEINQTQRSNLSEALLPASLSPPHIQSSDFSTSVPTYTQTYLPAAEQTPKSLNSVLAAELEEIYESQASISDWQKRRKNSEIKWGERRSMLFSWTLSKLGVPDKGKCCVQCRSCEASIKCEDCFHFLCHKCDQQQHFVMPFHQRFCWKNGFFEPLDPTQTVCSDGNVIHWKPVVPAHPPNSCPNCSESKFTTLSSNNLCIFVTLSGRYDLYTPIFRCKCGYVDEELGKAMHQSGFYSTGRNSSTFYSINLLDSWHFLKRSSPGTSLQALVSALELFGASRGRHGPINFETTKRVFFEWRFHQYELGRIKGEFDKGCPACDTTPVAVHIDGNKKLYRYNKVGRGIRNSYYSGGIFACDKEVQYHVSTIQNLKTQVLYGGRWQEGSGLTSGEEAEQVFSYLSRYNNNTKNMLKAERTEELTEGALFWNHRKINGMPRALVARFRKVLYGGRWQEGSGLTSGEEAEQVFSYLSRYNNNTKNMLKAERTEELTEGALFWNHRKINGMHRALVARFRKATETAAAVSNEIHRLNVPESVIEKWRSELLIIARSLNNRSSANNIEHTIEAYGENIRHRKNQITTYAVSLTEKRSAVEKFELQKRCREEESLTIQEMITWLQYYKKKRDKLSEYIQELQCDSFPSCLCKDSNTYTIENPILSEEEKHGLLALLKQGQKQCADKLTEAKHLFSSYQPNEVYEPFLELLESDEDEDMYLQNE
nr:uncharacterized protein LOC123761009 [Procambarus clarkii]